MNSVERIKSICKERKIPISKLEKDLGFSNAYISQLRKGVLPTDRLLAVAQYLSVSPDYLLNGDETKKAPTFTSLLLESSGYWDGERLAELRNERGYSIKQLSSWLEISEEEYKCLESGAFEPSFTSLLRMADIFAYDLDYLCHRTTKSKSSIHNELEILNLYCKLDDTGKASAFAALKGLLDAFPGEETISTPKEA